MYTHCRERGEVYPGPYRAISGHIAMYRAIYRVLAMYPGPPGSTQGLLVVPRVLQVPGGTYQEVPTRRYLGGTQEVPLPGQIWSSFRPVYDPFYDPFYDPYSMRRRQVTGSKRVINGS